MSRRSREPDALRDLLEQLEAVRLDQCGAPLGVLAQVRQLVGLDAVVYARLLERTGGWGLEGFETDGVLNPTRFRRVLSDFFENRAAAGPWLDLARPDAGQCNTAVRVDASTYRGTELFEHVLKPAGLDGYHVLRVLLCEDGTVRGWLGGFAAKRVSERQRKSLETIAATLVVRMRIERLLTAAPRIHAALEAVLQQMGGPALIVDGRGRIHEMNRAARDLLTTQRRAVSSSLTALFAKQEPELPFTLTHVSGTAGAEQFLAVLRPRSEEARRTLAVTLAGVRWQLTVRQLDVLPLVVRGESNATIATELAIGERAVELHVSAIFNRARVSSRAQLIAAVLLG